MAFIPAACRLGPTKEAFQSSSNCRAFPFVMCLCCLDVGAGRLGLGGTAGSAQAFA